MKLRVSTDTKSLAGPASIGQSRPRQFARHSVVWASMCLVMLGEGYAASQEQPLDAQSESARFSKVRAIVITVKTNQLLALPSSIESTRRCEEALAGLLRPGAAKPIEPFRIVASAEAPDDAHAVCGPGDANGDEDRAQRLFEGLTDKAGGAPFRLYHLSKSTNPYPNADLFLYASSNLASRTSASYRWIDTKSCEYVEAFTPPADAGLGFQAEDAASAVAEYQSQVAVFSASRRGRVKIEMFSASPTRRLVCTWSTVGSIGRKP